MERATEEQHQYGRRHANVSGCVVGQGKKGRADDPFWSCRRTQDTVRSFLRGCFVLFVMWPRSVATLSRKLPLWSTQVPSKFGKRGNCSCTEERRLHAQSLPGLVLDQARLNAQQRPTQQNGTLQGQ